MFYTKDWKKNRAHILCSKTFPRKQCRLWDTVTNMLRPDRPQATLQHGACALHAGYIRLQTHTQNMLYLLFFKAKMHTRAHLKITFIRILPYSSLNKYRLKPVSPLRKGLEFMFILQSSLVSSSPRHSAVSQQRNWGQGFSSCFL